MKAANRLVLVMGGVAAAPAAVLALCLLFPPLPRPLAFLAAAVSAGLAAFLGRRSVLGGLLSPMERVSAAAEALTVKDARLYSALKPDGWLEGGRLISAMNRLMLELGAFRAFHLNQVVEDRAKAQALIETITDCVLLADDKGQLIYSNQRALDLLGIPKQEGNVSLPGSVRKAEFAAALAGMLQMDAAEMRSEVQLPGPEVADGGDRLLGVARTYLLQIKPFNLANLKKPGRVIVVRDITMEKEIESARETFFHMITHDMRGPLASIQGYAQMLGLKMVGSSDDLGKMLNVIVRASKRLNGMIEDILNTIKLERGGMQLHAVRMDAAAVCAGVFEVYEPLAARKKIAFSMPPAAKLELDGDPSLLDRVISNLVGNALKFTPVEGSVSLSVCGGDGQALFCVEDNGPGVPKDKQLEIFEKYAQMEEHKYMGFGLGLAMCKMAVKLHGGRIWVESQEGKGSRFCFSLPLRRTGTALRGTPL